MVQIHFIFKGDENMSDKAIYSVDTVETITDNDKIKKGKVYDKIEC